MGDDINQSPVKNNGATPELSPQNDGTKVLLAENVDVKVEEAKFKKGDTEINVGVPKSFSGLTKEELMKYSKDPFWIKLRMFLFVLFWLIWLAMLVIAIVIIIKAPACAPPPERLWVEEKVMVKVDPSNLPDFEVLNEKLNSMAVLSTYFPGLIDAKDFTKSDDQVDALIKAITTAKKPKKVVAEFPLGMSVENSLFENATDLNLIDESGAWNYTNKEQLLPAMREYFLDYWIDKGVTGFLMAEEDGKDSGERYAFKEQLNDMFKDKNVAVGSNMVNFESTQLEFSASAFRTFLFDNEEDWAFYQVAAGLHETGRMNSNDARLAKIGLFLFEGTPILTDYISLEDDTIELIKKLSVMRENKGIKLGNVSMAIETTENVVAFTRTYKGTPAYAIALNFKEGNETVDFTGTSNVNTGGAVGSVEIDSKNDTTMFDVKSDKLDLRNIKLGPYQGLVIQFVPKFD